VIVNYRTPVLTLAAMESALAEEDVRRVVVVDSASGDDSAAVLRGAITDERVRVVEATRNKGFGAGVNLGVAAAGTPLVLVLNSDATLRPGTLGLLVTALLADDNLGVLAPAIVEGDGRTPQAAAFGPLPHRWQLLVPGPMALLRDTGRADETRPGWVSGVAMLLRTADFRALGGFDEDFEMYFEDVDLCRRIRERGQSVGRLPAATVVHAAGSSWRSVRDQKRQFHRSKAIYAGKVGATGVELRIIGALGRARVALAAR
jgi:N-acetylglucosaminyl-diphospho-decaprenol L-rhamnosyltransferase